MKRIPDSLKFAKRLMNKTDLFHDFKIPEKNKQMGKAIEEYLGRDGKCLRPAIIFSTIKTYNKGEVMRGYWAAVSLRYDHNFFLVHDDFEDDSYWRRSKRTMHILYGDDFAINYGDYLRTLAGLAMDKASDTLELHTQIRLFEARHEMLKITCEGQDLEFQLRKQPLSEMTEQRILAILKNKTAFYTIWTPYRYGCMISGLPNEQICQLKHPLINVGVAFQITDDVLDLRKPDKKERGRIAPIIKKFGKDWAGDLEEAKRTLPLMKLYSRAKNDDLRYMCEKLDVNGEMKKLVGERYRQRKKGMNEKDPDFMKIVDEIDEIKSTIIDMMTSYGVIEDSKEEAEKLYYKNIPQIESLLPESEGKKELLELLHFAVFRDF